MEVHPPHHPIHTWREFLIHIATIVIGLLIAIGLEQVVEWFHHKREISETREALQREHESNVAAFHRHVEFLHRATAYLHINLQDLLLLKAHPGTKPEELPGWMVWKAQTEPTATAAWMTARSTGVDALMPRPEVEKSAEEYLMLEDIHDYHRKSWEIVNRCGQYRYVDANPANMNEPAIDNAIECTKQAMVANFLEGVAMSDLAGAYPDYAPGPSLKDLQALQHEPNRSDPAFAAAMNRTESRVQQAMSETAGSH